MVKVSVMLIHQGSIRGDEGALIAAGGKIDIRWLGQHKRSVIGVLDVRENCRLPRCCSISERIRKS